MRELAFLAYRSLAFPLFEQETNLHTFLTMTILVVDANHTFWINTEWHFLYLYRLEQIRNLLLRLLSSNLLCFTLGFIGSFSLLFWRAASAYLGL